MSKITLTFSNNKSVSVEARIKGSEILDFLPEGKKGVIALKADNEIISLARPIKVSSRITPVYLNTKEGAAIYRRSLCFVLACAAFNRFPGQRLLVGHSLGYGYYYTLDGERPITKEQIEAIKEEMVNFISKNIKIVTQHISYDEAVSNFKALQLTETCKQMDYNVKREVLVNKFEGDRSVFCDIYFGPLVESTGVLQVFDLMPYGDGFLLRFPKHDEPDKLQKFKDNPKIFEVYQNYKKWGKTVNVTSVASLNALNTKTKRNDFIDICETFQTQNYAKVAQMIKDRGNVKVVLIAGPSSSGKTTSAYKISLHLRALGYNPKVISLDNYYLGHDKTPRDENGNFDFECLEALNVEMLNQNLVDLFEGKEIELPAYNFDCGQSYMSGKFMKLGPNDILIMEGIHGLNDKLTPLVKPEYKFKIYLSALTQLNLDDHNRVPTSDNRLIRRIVRDSHFRGKPAAGTIAMWDSVQKGEQLHIFPFQNNADAVLNTALDYEISVLKVYAEPMLKAVKPSEPEYTEACRLLGFLENFSTIPSDYVPKQSIIREFIGGSSFKY